MRVVYGGVDGFDAVLYGEQSQKNMNFFTNQMQMLSQPLMQANAFFAQTAQNLYDQFNGSEALRIARAAMRAVQGVFMRDQIQYLDTLTHCQVAPVTMQRWVMANPVVRQMYHNQEIDGYSETYTDVEPNKVGEDHYDYRRVIDGVVRFDSTDSDVAWEVTSYCEELREGDRNLELFEKADILNTWDIIEHFVKHGKSDPTSVWNNNL